MDAASDDRAWFARPLQSPRHASLALVLLCLAVYLPGVLRLPAVDRTEIVYAETTRDLVARGAWLDPRYGGEVQAFRPIGTFWAQGVSAVLAGADNARSIIPYRLPGLIAVTLSVLALYWLAAPLVGSGTALMAAALFAVAPLTVLVAQLAIAEGLSLLPATLAMLAMLRIYGAPPCADTRGLAAIFWLALGVGMLINALLVPILVAATLIALAVMDRDLRWLNRTHPLFGVPVALLMAGPWIAVRVLQDGVPFAGLTWRETLAALGGSQDMKHRAMPGTFVLALVLGFLPGTALLPPALVRLWNGRDAKAARFLLAWIIGYLVYLELISSKPGTYMVQVMFPALALAVAMLVSAHAKKSPPPRWHMMPWPPVAALFAVGLFAAVYIAAGERPDLIATVLILVIAVLFFISAAQGRAGDLFGWWRNGVAALALFAVTLLAVILPSIDKVWPARELQRFMAASCPAGTSFGIASFREPSAAFSLGAPREIASADDLVARNPAVHIVESRWLERYFVANASAGRGQDTGTPLGCITAINTMRACPVSFTVFQRDAAANCKPLTTYLCNGGSTALPQPPSSRCD